MNSYVFLTGLVLVLVPHLNVLFTVDACSLQQPPNVCNNVTCPYGKTCHPYFATWCQNRVLDFCYPPFPVCGDVTDPCKVTVCPYGTECFSVQDQCSSAGCTIKAQCEATSKPGTCPPPRPVGIGDCDTSCQNDAKCPSGMKCCTGVTGTGTSKFCFRTLLTTGR